MAKEMLINVSEGEECRIALLEDGRLEELYMERTSSTSHVGNIYKGRVTNVEPSIQAAFVDFGLGRNGFLHISDLMPQYFGRNSGDYQETVGRKMARRDRPPIQKCLRRGDQIIVQIIKEGIGTKGPTLSTYLSIPGRILVMMPGMGKMGISRKIEDDDERRRLRQIMDSLKPPKDVGFIVRTAGIGKTKAEIQRDLNYLVRLWQNFTKKEQSGPGPMELYREGDLVTRTVRDVFASDIHRIVADNKDVARRVREVIRLTSPRTKNKVELFEAPIPIFHKYGIEREIEQIYSRHVPLPSGGSLVIDSTEAIVAIDVNSGKFRDHADAETTAFKTDMEAADEIPRQLRLRDLGGVIICDFIDLRYERHRRELERRLHENLKRDRAKTKVLRMSQFGIIEMTRQRMRPSLKRSIYFDCPHCKGAGLVKTPESMSLDVMRKLAISVNDLRVLRVQLSVCPDISFYLLNKKRAQLSELEAASKKKIVVRTDNALGLDEVKLELFDARDGAVVLEELGMTQPVLPHTTQLGPRSQPLRKHDRRKPGQQRPSRPIPSPQAAEERFEFDEEDDPFVDREERMGSSASELGVAPTLAEEPEPLSAEVDVDLDAEVETEPADDIEPAAVEVEGGDVGNGEGDAPGSHRRRRRRRGRRGRGRGGNVAGGEREPHRAPEVKPAPQPSDAAAQDVEPERAEDESSLGQSAPKGGEGGDAGPRPRRRRRGGRGRRRSKAPALATDEHRSSSVALSSSANALPEQPVVKTGSTDRHHLVQDEPVAPQPVARPRTYRDLDAIPDDFD